MKSIHIRDIDQKTLRGIKLLAKLHHRSMQGELKAILSEAAKRLPADLEEDELDLVKVETGGSGRWRREDIYNDAR